MTIYSWKALGSAADSDTSDEIEAAFLALIAVDDSVVVRALQASAWEQMQQGMVAS